MLKKILCILLLLCLLLPMTVACSNKGNEGESETLSGTDAGNNESEQNSNGAPVPYMDDFQGYEFRVLSGVQKERDSFDITGELMGTPVSAATYKRNAQLKEKYNFEIVEYKETDWLSKAEVAGGSGEDTYDMWCFDANDIPSFGQSGYLWNLNEVDGLNLDAEYYDQSTRELSSFANHLFFLTGDMLYFDDASTEAILFNTKLFDQYKLSDIYGKDLYQLVEDKEWTLEKMKEFSRLATHDNGDGVWDTKDNYGYVYQNVDVLSYNIAFGNRLLEKDTDDIFYLNDSETLVNDMMDIFNFLNSGYCTPRKLNRKVDCFYTEKALFSTTWLSDLTTDLPQTGIEFGIVPLPMNEEGQEKYYSLISATLSNCITICKSVKDIDKTANIIELISYESMSTLTPAFEQWLFGGRLIHHASDVKMLEYILENKTFELCHLWSTGSLFATMQSLNAVNGEGIASAMAGCEESVKASVARKLERINQLT